MEKADIAEVFSLQFIRYCTFCLSLTLRCRTSCINIYGGSALRSQFFYGKYKTCTNCKKDVSLNIEKFGVVYTGYLFFVIAFWWRCYYDFSITKK